MHVPGHFTEKVKASKTAERRVAVAAGTVHKSRGTAFDLQKKSKMSCCSEVMQPIETSSCCTPKDSAAQAARVMRDSGCGCAPVIADTKDLKLVGVVTERDVCCSVVADSRDASKMLVEEIMRPSSACCEASESTEKAHRKLLEHRTTSLPVINEAGGCCGTISIQGLEKV